MMCTEIPRGMLEECREQQPWCSLKPAKGENSDYFKPVVNLGLQHLDLLPQKTHVLMHFPLLVLLRLLGLLIVLPFSMLSDTLAFQALWSRSSAAVA